MAQRGRANFQEMVKEHEEVFLKAAKMTVGDRNEAKQRGVSPLPGQAEYIDLLNAMFHSDSINERSPEDTLEMLSEFILRKHSETQG